MSKNDIIVIFIIVSYIEIYSKLPSLNYSNYGVNPLRFSVFVAYFIVVVILENACFRVGRVLERDLGYWLTKSCNHATTQRRYNHLSKQQSIFNQFSQSHILPNETSSSELTGSSRDCKSFCLKVSLLKMRLLGPMSVVLDKLPKACSALVPNWTLTS